MGPRDPRDERGFVCRIARTLPTWDGTVRRDCGISLPGSRAAGREPVQRLARAVRRGHPLHHAGAHDRVSIGRCGIQEVSFFDDNFQSLRTRVRRLETDSAWAETPPSRTRHFVSNVLAAPGSGAGEYAITLNFIITRSRGDQGYQFFTGRREDTLRREASGQLRIARRRILVDQTVITATNLSILF